MLIKSLRRLRKLHDKIHSDVVPLPFGYLGLYQQSRWPLMFGLDLSTGYVITRMVPSARVQTFVLLIASGNSSIFNSTSPNVFTLYVPVYAASV
ncbi:hypothetical protein Tco_0428693 [Tanacetum coccineum]